MLARTVIRKVMAKPFSVKNLFEQAMLVLGRTVEAAPMTISRTLTGEAA
jgi:hypothetical protein